jgi:hypothetical protein
MRSFSLPMTPFAVIFFLFISISRLPAAQAVEEPDPVLAVRVTVPITIDGLLEEPAWKRPGTTGFRQIDPEDGCPATEKTEVWVAYDDKNLYLAARMYDSDPGEIISRLGRRDVEVESDWFYFGIDPYYDRRSGYFFAVNPAGGILDGTLFNDEGQDSTWDGIWESAATIDGKGWTAEIRIPYRQLRFKEKAEYTWGINFYRLIQRKNELSCYSWIPKEESGQVSRFAPLTGIKDIHPGRLVEVLPFSVGKAHFSPPVQGNPFRTGKDISANAGFDLKASLQTNLTLNATANPDFGQVEVDPAVINISDQETYYAEKRPFFVEGADIFRFGYGGANTVQNLGWSNPLFFYSRRIGRSPQGYVTAPGYAHRPDWTTILAAAKVTGKIGDGWNLGFLGSVTQREYAALDWNGQRSAAEIEPFTGYSVLRAQKEFKDGFRGFGLIATGMWRDLKNADLSASLTRSALSLAVDGWTFLDGDRRWVFTGWFGGSKISGSPEAMTRLQMSSLHYFQRPDVDYVEVNPEATTLGGWAGRLYLNKQKGSLIFNAALGAVSPGFHANDVGYHTRGDQINGHIETGYRSFHPGKVLRTWRLTLSTYRNYDFSGNRTDEYYNFTGTAQLLNYWTGVIYLSYDPPRYSHYLTRGGPMAYYPAGIMRRISISSDSRRAVVLSLSGHYRTHPSGGYNYSFNIGIRWKPSDNFSLSVAPGYSWRHSEGQYIRRVEDELKTETYGVRYILSDIIQETAPLEIRINWTFTPRLSLQAFLQPFIGVGDYFLYKELRAARTFDFDVFGEDNGSTITLENGLYTVDPDGPGPAEDFSFRDSDFNLKSLRGTVVLRWEFLPGSTIYAVWTTNRANYAHPGDFHFSRDWWDLWAAKGDNIFLFKFSYRFEL